MPFSRRNRPSLKTKKIETTVTLLATDISATQELTLVSAVNDPTGDTDVNIGSKIRWVYIEFNFAQEAITNPIKLEWQVTKNPGNLITMNPQLYSQSYRKFIFKRGMEMIPKDLSTVFKRIITVRIPPRYRRMDEADQLQFQFRTSAAQLTNFCCFAIISVEV